VWIDFTVGCTCVANVSFVVHLPTSDVFTLTADYYAAGVLQKAALYATVTGITRPDSATSTPKNNFKPGSKLEWGTVGGADDWKDCGHGKHKFRTKVIHQVPGDPTTPITGVQVSPTNPGYYSFFYEYVTTNGGNCDTALVIESNADSMAHRCLPEFDVNQASVLGFRMLGVNQHFMNTAPPIDKNGDVYNFQSPRSTPWTTWAYGGVPYIGSIRQEINKPAENGSYEWLRPHPRDLAEFDTPVLFSGGASLPSTTVFQIDNESDYLVTYITVPLVAGQAGKWLWYWSFEFQTNSLWQNSIMPTTPPEVWEKALRVLANCPQVFDNPTHLRDIWNAIKSGIKQAPAMIEKYGPGISSFAKLLSS